MAREERENVIEWLNGDTTAAFTFNQRKFITKAERLAKEFPSRVQILARNKDGSIFGHISLKGVVISTRSFKKEALGSVSEKEVE